MSKSKGNVVTPMGLLEQFGSDAVRYWAADGRPGTDTAFDEGQMKVGRRLAIKVLNVSKFILGLPGDPVEGAAVDHPVDRAMLARLATLVDQATTAFEGYDYARALERTESFFWWFCDDYVELVKGRAYGNLGDSTSARAALEEALATLLRLLAPVLPYATEEAWSWWQEGSVHRAAWPDPTEAAMAAGDGNPLVTEVASAALGEIRKAKTEAGASLRAEVDTVVVRDTPERLAALSLAAEDVRDAAKAQTLTTEEDEAFSVTVTLAAQAEG
jgi:valyl-tRNA synthetase